VGYDVEKNKETLLKELAEMHSRVAELKLSNDTCKKTERSLRESEQRHNALLSNIPSVIWITDREGNTTFISQNVERVYGYTPEEIYAKGDALWFDRIHPSDIERIKLAYGRIFESDESFDVEYRIKTKQGEWIWLNDKAVTTYEEDGSRYAFGVFSDITERKTIEEKLKESERRFRETLENINLIAVQLNRDGTITFANNFLLEFTGWRRQDILNRNWLDIFIHEDIRDEIRSLHHANVAKGSVTIHHENEIITKSGARRLVSWNNSHSFDSSGNIMGITSIGEDITSRRNIEESLKASEEKFKAVVEGAAVGILAADAKTKKFVFANPAICEITGYSNDEIRKLSVLEIHPEKDLSYVLEEFESQRRGNKETAVNIPVLRKDGKIIYCDINSKTISFEGNEVLVGFFSDITARRNAEDDLKKSEKKFRSLFENMHEGCAYHKILTDENNRPVDYEFLMVNSSFEKATGLKRESAIGSKVTDLIPGIKDETPDLISIYGEVAQTGKDAKFELFFEPFNKWYLVNSYSPLKDHFVSIFTDITEDKKIEAERLRTQKLESIGLLAGGIAHDFNNILAALINNLFLIKSHVKPEGQLYERILEAEKASFRAQALTHQLLTFSTGGAPVKELINIEEITREAASFVLRGSNVNCVHISPGNIWPVMLDAGQGTQVINNIIINANHSMPGGGRITVTYENVVIGKDDSIPLKEGYYVKTSFKDEGIGIPQEQVSKIFDPYFTTKQDGSGLGLSTAYSIIRRHDGYIEVKSEQGSGSVFSIYFQARRQKIKDIPISESQPLPGKGKILIMDDDDAVRESLGQMIQSLGYNVEYAHEGNEAVIMYKEALTAGSAFEAIIMDLTIPGGMGGKEAVQALRLVDPEVKAIVSSGYSNDPVISDYRNYGFKGVLPKPFKSVMSLSRVLHEIITGSKD
jgi:PAS domain S-box-containing protein